MITFVIITIGIFLADLAAALPFMWVTQILHTHQVILGELDYGSSLGVLVLMTFASVVYIAIVETAKAIVS